MQIKETSVTIRKIVASEGHILTNGNTYGKIVYLGVNDNPDSWTEITEEEYEALRPANEPEEAEAIDEEAEREENG